ncbi:MAG TPA: hypothetical protein VGO90_08355, partial [Chthoniobacteraceae bacterium]|nr:hypothetical protein [Chthoniobacteraceae bacterium]
MLSRGRTWKGVFAPWFAALYGFDLPQLARLAWPWTFLFLWPAFALAVAALARIYRKGNGQLTWLTRILLAPLI